MADSKLSILTNLLWLIICVCCSTFAIYLVRESYTMWQKEPVITTLKSVGKPVTEIAFPTVTICSPGLFVENVKVALEKSFNQWRFQGDKGLEESGIPSLMAEFMEEKFQMKDSDNVNIMNIDDHPVLRASRVSFNKICAHGDGRANRRHRVFWRE